MSIPPFPSQDLAKLVLGYLAEEQLMTAYDEFLQASPYLDAMHNEYDRIFMKPLKTILAEYRAVKIYVETCKPFLLRKKLLQCSNILEIVRFLINHIDVSKLSVQEHRHKISSEKINKTTSLGVCDVCDSLKLLNCVCKSKQTHQQVSNYLQVNLLEQISLANLVQTTPIADLPGSYIQKRKKGHSTDCTLTQSYGTCLMSEQCSKQPHSENNYSLPIIENSLKPIPINTEHDISAEGCHVTESNHKMEFNNVLSSVCNNNALRDNGRSKTKPTSRKKPFTDSFQDFASGVGGCQNQNAIPPDSSISEIENVQDSINNNICGNIIGTSTPHLLLKVETVTNNIIAQDKIISNGVSNGHTYSIIEPLDQKIRILSDVKVDNYYKSNDIKNKLSINNAMNNVANNTMSNIANNAKNNIANDTMNNTGNTAINNIANNAINNITDNAMNNMANNAVVNMANNSTSNPLMKIQTIVINGKPAYKTQSMKGCQQTFSKDEIMSMPTIVVYPLSDRRTLPVITQAQPVTSETTSSIRTQNNTNKILSPLIIDITEPTTTQTTNTQEADMTKEILNNKNDDQMINAPINLNKSSIQKDIATFSVETSTPQIVTLTKKSSSTPRRTSHIRVLDFATPRRILHETVSEQNCDDNNENPVEVVITDSSMLKSPSGNMLDEKDILKNTTCYDKIQNVQQSAKIPKPTLILKKDTWDTKLRAMVAANENMTFSSNGTKKIKNKKNDDSTNSKDKKKNKLLKSKQVKKNEVIYVDDDSAQNNKIQVVPIKPTINIKSGTDWNRTSTVVDKKQTENKEKLLDKEYVDTPEVDRLSLQNEIGVKLNISELLETPYKQALYDIQMETPRCLGLDLPDEPISDIKIMNIPTPRFFDTPKIIAATPSYSTRATDYSSGSSYYKPDDQDFVPSSDLKPVDTSSKKDVKHEPSKENSGSNRKHLRPVRKCAKNVSYYNMSKITDADDKSISDGTSPCSDSVNSILFKKKNEKVNSKDRFKNTKKSEDKKNSTRKRKSPIRKEKPKTFMKIKPRKSTPTKDSLVPRIRKKTFPCSSPKIQRKRTTSKEKSSYVTPAECFIPTKSRRKSSTPRKLHCSKTFNSESHTMSEVNEKQNIIRESHLSSTQDADAKQLALHMYEDRSQDVKINEEQTNTAQDSEDISKIQEYIETTVINNRATENNSELRTDINRSFDIETARIIERDLLDTPPHNDNDKTVLEKPINFIDSQEANTLEKTSETDSTIKNELPVVHSEEDEDDIVLSVHECNEEQSNFILFEYDDNKRTSVKPPITLKDNFTMEVCIEDDVTIRLQATPFCLLYDHYHNDEEKTCNITDTKEEACLISNTNTFGTPLKDSIKTQVYDIFDSTLTSLDTPLKVHSPKEIEQKVIINTIVLEEEDSNSTDKVDPQKRKRHQSDEPEENPRQNKKSKPDTQMLLSPPNMHDMMIEAVLTKLHGP